MCHQDKEKKEKRIGVTRNTSEQVLASLASALFLVSLGALVRLELYVWYWE